MTCNDVRYSIEAHADDADDVYTSWVLSEMYAAPTLSTVGNKLILYAVPFQNSDGYRCDVCEFDPPMNPCTDFDSPIDIEDCDGNLCSDYDYCPTIESIDLTESP